MKDWKGKTAVVTGAASGIGLALARRFAAEGMNVVLADIEEPALSEAASSIKSDMGVVAVRTDVSKWKSVAALAERTFAEFGTAHIVCNNAGVGTGKLIKDTTIDDWRWVISVDLFGVIHGILAFLPRLLEQDEGHIVNIASISGLATAPLFGPYMAAKHGVVAISETLCQELALQESNVGVTVLCPGVVSTRLYDSERNRPGRRAKSRIPDLARQAFEEGIEPADIAAVCVDAIRANRPMAVPAQRWMLDGVKRRLEGILAVVDEESSAGRYG